MYLSSANTSGGNAVTRWEAAKEHQSSQCLRYLRSTPSARLESSQDDTTAELGGGAEEGLTGRAGHALEAVETRPAKPEPPADTVDAEIPVAEVEDEGVGEGDDEDEADAGEADGTTDRSDLKTDGGGSSTRDATSAVEGTATGTREAATAAAICSW